MKKLLVLFTVLLSQNSFSQNEVLPVDESGKYTFYEVVELKSFESTSLFKNAESFLKNYVHKKFKNDIQAHVDEGRLTARSSFLVYKKGSLGKNVDGAIEYSLMIDVKENKYRYVLTDFVFREYERNRYGKSQPVNGRQRNLEEPASDLNRWQWDEHKKTIKEKMEELIAQLKLDMLKKEEQESKKTKVNDNW